MNEEMMIPSEKRTMLLGVKRRFLWLHQVHRVVMKSGCLGTPPYRLPEQHTERGATSFTRNSAESGSRRQFLLFSGFIFILT